MRSSFSLIVFFATTLVSCAPFIEERAKINDGELLNYALTLEHLEDNFYRQGLAKYSQQAFAKAGYGKTFYENLKKISKDEIYHVNFITGALKSAGVTPVKACKYNFGHKDVKTFLATASILEGVGVSAYLGAAASILDKDYLTSAGAILTVEARHSSYLRSRLNKSPYPQPLDVPLTLNEVHSMASQFITSCPTNNPPLPVKAFPKLTLAKSTKMTLKAGDTVTLHTTVKPTNGAKLYAAFIALPMPSIVEAKPVTGGFSVKIPAGFSGQTYVVLTKKATEVSDDTVAAGPVILEI